MSDIKKKIKPGFFPHHTEDCIIEFVHEVVSENQPRKAYWCSTHRQWCNEFPVRIVAIYEDGSTTELRRR